MSDTEDDLEGDLEEEVEYELEYRFISSDNTPESNFCNISSVYF